MQSVPLNTAGYRTHVFVKQNAALLSVGELFTTQTVVINLSHKYCLTVLSEMFLSAVQTSSFLHGEKWELVPANILYNKT